MTAVIRPIHALVKVHSGRGHAGDFVGICVGANENSSPVEDSTRRARNDWPANVPKADTAPIIKRTEIAPGVYQFTVDSDGNENVAPNRP